MYYMHACPSFNTNSTSYIDYNIVLDALQIKLTDLFLNVSTITVFSTEIELHSHSLSYP